MASNDFRLVPVFSDNPEPRQACMVLADTSGSMEGVISSLNRGIEALVNSIKKDDLVSSRVELGLISFATEAKVEIPLNEGQYVTSSNLTASGSTNMAAAINTALDILEARKKEYKEIGLDYFRPWIMIISDGAPNEDGFKQAVSRLHSLEIQKKIVVFAIGVGSGANMSVLNNLSVNRQAVALDGLKFRELFEWLSASLSSSSMSDTSVSNEEDLMIAEQVEVAPIHGWTRF